MLALSEHQLALASVQQAADAVHEVGLHRQQALATLEEAVSQLPGPAEAMDTAPVAYRARACAVQEYLQRRTALANDQSQTMLRAQQDLERAQELLQREQEAVAAALAEQEQLLNAAEAHQREAQAAMALAEVLGPKGVQVILLHYLKTAILKQ